MKGPCSICGLLVLFSLQGILYFRVSATVSPDEHLNVTEAPYLSSTTETEVDNDFVASGANFLLRQRSPSSYGWEKETHRALTALAIAGALNPQDLEYKLMTKELELRLALAFAKHHQEPFPAGQLALYINALLALCKNPRDFYGLNLVANLKHRDEVQLSYSYSLQSLALCNAGVRLEKARILKLVEFIKEDPSEHGGFIDNLAMATLALACGQKYQPISPAERYLNSAVRKIKRRQNEDGSFGNIYSSGLANQALIMAEADDKKWNRSLARDYILSQQREDGSFQDFMGTFYALPVLMNSSLGSLANWSCPSTEQTGDDLVVTQRPERNETKISISLLVRAPEIQEYRVQLGGYRKDNMYTILSENEESIAMEFSDTAYGHMIVGVDGLNQDPSRNKYWIIYTVDQEGQEHSATTGVDGIFPEDGDRFVFELKTFKSV